MLRKLLVSLASPTLAALLISACAEVVPSAGSPSIHTAASPEPETTPTPDTDVSVRLFRNDPLVVTFVDVALAFVYFQRSDGTSEQVIESINALTNENLTLANFDSPFPTAADVAVFANPSDVLTLEDVAALFVVFQGATEQAEVAAAIANLIPGFDPADLIVVPGTPSPSPNPSPSPAVTPPPSSGPPPPVAGFSSDPVASSTIAIGNVVVGQTSTESITISETGNAELVVSAGKLGGANPDRFAVDPSEITIANGGAAQTIEISCTPTLAGSLTATLELTTNDPSNATVSYDLECAGTLSNVVNSNADGLLVDLDDDLTTCTLREAIAANNTNAAVGGCANPEGTIEFDPALTGTITLTAQPELITSGVTIAGPGRDQLTISGADTYQVFIISADAAVIIKNLTLTEGLATSSGGSGDGGAILSIGSGLLTIDSVTISDSTATVWGGGIFVTKATVDILNSTLSNNSAGSKGGGIFVSGDNAKATVIHSTLSGNSAGLSGGGIGSHTAIVSHSTLSGNSAFTGGGIFATNVEVSNSTLSGNGATFQGGGIRATNVEVSNSTLSGNSATSQGGGIRATNVEVSNSTLSGNSGSKGGGIYNTGATQITRSVLDANEANSYGGGIYNAEDATLNIRESTLSGNDAGTRGGGIYNDSNATLDIISSTLSGNSSSNSGGGIHNFEGTTSVANSTLSGNTANNYGGGIYHDKGITTIVNSTLSGNSSNYGGGLYSINSPTSVFNSLISGNLGSIGPEIRSNNTITFGGNNLVGQNGTSGFSIATEPGTFDTPLQLTSNIIAPLTNNGGSTQTHALVSGSPALGAGDQDICDDPPISGRDQRGEPRPQGDAVCDIGAFESDLL